MGYGPLVLIPGRAALGFGLLVLALGAAAQRLDFDWASKTGNFGADLSIGIATDSAGNIYDGGRVAANNLDVDPGPDEFIVTGSVYARKLDADGNFVYVVELSPDNPTTDLVFLDGHTVDSVGNLYLVGRYTGTTDFDPGAGTVSRDCASGACAYLLRLDPSGQFDAVWTLSSSGQLAQPMDVLVRATGEVFVMGHFTGTVDFDPGPGIFEITSQSNGSNVKDQYVLKLDGTGDFIFARAVGGEDALMSGTGISVDSSGAVYLSGSFRGAVDFDPGAGVQVRDSGAPVASGYLLKLDAAGDFVYVRTHESSAVDVLTGTAITSAGSLFSTGFFQGTIDFDPGSGALVHSTGPANDPDAYILKRDVAGDLEFAIVFGSIGKDTASVRQIDGFDNIYVTGTFEDSVDFDPSALKRVLTSTGETAAFVMVLDSTGKLLSADALTGTDRTGGGDLAFGTGGAVVMTGQFSGTTDFDPGSGTFELITPDSNADIYNLSLVPNRRVTSIPAAGLVQEGDSVTLQGPIGGNYQWRKDGVPIVDDPPRVVGATTHTLTIESVELSDSGVYRVGYDNGAKAIVTSDRYVLTVVPLGALAVGGAWWIAAAVGLVTASLFIRRTWSGGV